MHFDFNYVKINLVYLLGNVLILFILFFCIYFISELIYIQS